jgi:hypothetical protein
MIERTSSNAQPQSALDSLDHCMVLLSVGAGTGRSTDIGSTDRDEQEEFILSELRAKPES